MKQLSEAGEAVLVRFLERSLRAGVTISFDDAVARLEQVEEAEAAPAVPEHEDEDGEIVPAVAAVEETPAGLAIRFAPGECRDDGPHVLRFFGDDVEDAVPAAKAGLFRKKAPVADPED